MKIYTKGGDKGETSLVGGTRVSKAHIKIEAYGTVDELNSSIGVFANALDNVYAPFLHNIQHKLFNIGSLLAAEDEVPFELPSIDDEDIVQLEKEIDRLNENLPKLKTFILPGGSVVCGQVHLSRCICRRAERRVVALEDESLSIILRYLNRLSDYLFILSRDVLRLENKPEVKWDKEV